jgi:hypothetical protein
MHAVQRGATRRQREHNTATSTLLMFRPSNADFNDRTLPQH